MEVLGVNLGQSGSDEKTAGRPLCVFTAAVQWRLMGRGLLLAPRRAQCGALRGLYIRVCACLDRFIYLFFFSFFFAAVISQSGGA